jgi:uncharacterized membrane protein
MVGDRTERPARWTRVLAWIGAWALVVAAGSVLPTWAAIALAIAVFAAQLLLAPGRGACHLPEDGRGGVTKAARPAGG